MKKKFLILLLTLSFLVTIMSGCSWPDLFKWAGGGQSNSSNVNNGSPVYSAVNFNVANIQKLTDINNALDENNFDEYTNLKKVLARIGKSIVEVNTTSTEGNSFGSGVVIGTSVLNNSESQTSDSSSQSNAGTFSNSSTSQSISASKSSGKSNEIISFIITCHHVIQVQGAATVTVTAYDGKEYVASFVGSDPSSDICVISVKGELIPVEIYTDSDMLEMGEGVIALGNPLGLGGTATSGIVSSSVRDFTFNNEVIPLIQTDAAINAGNSGGGLFTSTGLFIGMANYKYNEYFPEVLGIGFAIPSNKVMEISTQLIDTCTSTSPGYIPGKYYIGCTVKDVYTTVWGTQIDVTVTEIDPIGSFQKSSIAVNDVMNSVRYKDVNYTITRATEFNDFINSTDFSIGDELIFKITRNKTSLSIVVTIEQFIYGK